METKTCIGCKETRPETDFRWRIKALGVRIPRCSECDRKYRARYYKANVEKARQITNRAIANRRKKVASGEIVELKTKKCIECEKTYPVKFFRWADSSRLLRLSRCRYCDKNLQSEKYYRNKSQYLESNYRSYQKLRVILDECKNNPCIDCGNSYPPYVMDFDHRDPKTKVAKVSALTYWGSEKKLLDEVAKCDLVCSNCHRIRTHNKRKGDQQCSKNTWDQQKELFSH